MSFFETTPAGRILNRFSRYGSLHEPNPLDMVHLWAWLRGIMTRLNMLTWLHSDIYRVDEVLARTFNMVRSFEQLCYLRHTDDRIVSFSSIQLGQGSRWLS